MSNVMHEGNPSDYSGFLPTYELENDHIKELTQELLTQYPSGVSGRFVGYELDGTSRFSNIGRSVESKVFYDTFGNTEKRLEEEYGPYEASSSFFVIFDQGKQVPVGALRIIKNSEQGLKTLNDVAGKPLFIPTEDFQAFHGVEDLDACWDVGTVAVLPEYRTSPMKSALNSQPQPNIMLYRALYVKALAENIDHFVAVIDDKALKGLRLLGVPFVPMNDSESFPYIDSGKSQALYGHVPEFFDKMEARFQKIKEAHPWKSKLLARPLGQLMLGKNTDEKLLLNHQ